MGMGEERPVDRSHRGDLRRQSADDQEACLALAVEDLDAVIVPPPAIARGGFPRERPVECGHHLAVAGLDEVVQGVEPVEDRDVAGERQFHGVDAISRIPGGRAPKYPVDRRDHDRADCDRRDRVPFPWGTGPGPLLEAAPRGGGRHSRDSRRPLEHRCAFRPPARAGREVDHPLGWLRRGNRPLRSCRLWNLTARSVAHGPATAPAARNGLGGSRGCGRATRPPSGLLDWCLRGHLDPRLRTPADQPRRAKRHRHLQHHRRYAQYRRQPPLVLLRPPRSEPRDRYRLLVIAHRAPPRLREPPPRGLHAGAGWWRQRVASADAVPRIQPHVDALADRTLPRIRCGRRRLRPGRGRWHRRTETALAGRSRWRSHLRGCSGNGRQPGWPDQRTDRAERRGAGGARASGLRAGGRRSRGDRVRRGPRYGHPGG